MRRVVLVLSAMALALLLATGLAWAATKMGTPENDRIIGTPQADLIDAKGGDDSVRAKAGNDDTWGRSGEDRLFGGTGNDDIHTGGDFPDVVDCGPGRKDFVTYDSTDRVVNCERKEFRDDDSSLRQSGATPVAD